MIVSKFIIAYIFHFLLKLLIGKVWQSALFKKLFYFTCKIELILELSLKLFLAGRLFRPYYLFWKTLYMSTCNPTTFPNIVTSSYTFCPQIQREDLFYINVVTVVLMDPFKIEESGIEAWTPNYLVYMLAFELIPLFSMQDCLPLK